MYSINKTLSAFFSSFFFFLRFFLIVQWFRRGMRRAVQARGIKKSTSRDFLNECWKFPSLFFFSDCGGEKWKNPVSRGSECAYTCVYTCISIAEERITTFLMYFVFGDTAKSCARGIMYRLFLFIYFLFFFSSKIRGKEQTTAIKSHLTRMSPLNRAYANIYESINVVLHSTDNKLEALNTRTWIYKHVSISTTSSRSVHRKKDRVVLDRYLLPRLTYVCLLSTRFFFPLLPSPFPSSTPLTPDLFFFTLSSISFFFIRLYVLCFFFLQQHDLD